jgi:CBS domain-containing protein
MSAIRQLMMTDMITASSGETVAEVATRMSRNRVGAVLVIQDGKIEGLFSERDLLNRVVTLGLPPSSVRVGEVATRDVVAVDIDCSVKELLQIFRAKRFRHLPILEEGRPVGILSTRDLLERSVDALESYIEQSAYDRDLKEGTDPYEHFGGAYKRS